MQLKRVAEAKLPTPWGDFLMVGFEIGRASCRERV